MKALIVDNKTDDLIDVAKFCQRRNISYVITVPDNIDKLAATTFDLVILSGGIWYDDPTQQEFHYRSELEFITRSGTPLVGICLGMQLIAAAYGGELMELKDKYLGSNKVTLTLEGQRRLGLGATITVFENHTIGVVKNPPQFNVLGHSEECIEIMQHQSLPILCMQFHPEKSQRDIGETIWDSVFKLLVLSN